MPLPGVEVTPAKIVQAAPVQETLIQVEEVCTCNDEYATTFCPVHPPEVQPTKDVEYGEDDVLIITDADMSETGYGFFEGYIFTCPSCGLDAIMVNPSMGKSCTSCRRKIEVRSRTITAKIRSLSSQQGSAT